MGIRKNFIVNKKIQGFYVLLTALIVFLTGISMGLATYCVFFNSIARQLGAIQLVHSDYKIVTSEDVSSFIYIYIGVLLVSILTGLFFVFYTHRIVGPWHRFKAGFEAIGKGDYTVRLKLRKNDFMQSVADSFNQMAEALEKRQS